MHIYQNYSQFIEVVFSCCLKDSWFEIVSLNNGGLQHISLKGSLNNGGPQDTMVMSVNH